jgi:cysteinyl-tRNA synthetase
MTERTLPAARGPYHAAPHMALSLYDTLTAAPKAITPIEPGHLRMYVCGPTVYDYAHLGHARCYVVYDVLYRHLLSTGLRVTYVRNVTDVNEKIDKRAEETGVTSRELADRFTREYREDMARLGNKEPSIEPTVSGHIAQIIALIERLVASGHAYQSAGDVYFDVSRDPDYGKLSHRDLTELRAGASERVDAEETARKKNPADFALWKSGDFGEMFDSPFGRGTPGWHIECSAMAKEHLGETFDLHGGGLDLVFPHHENEIAQSECASGKPLAACWVHNGFVEVDREKMSKSLGNFFTARELFTRCEPEAVRYAVMTVHYRSPLNLDVTGEAGETPRFPQFEEAERRVAYLYTTKRRLLSLPEERIGAGGITAAAEISGVAARISEALDQDLNMPLALAAIAAFLASVNELCDAATRKKGKATPEAVASAKAGFDAIDRVLGLGAQDAEAVLLRIRDRRARERGLSNALVEAKIEERVAARIAKDFARADEVRAELVALGVELLDGADGTSWTIP